MRDGAWQPQVVRTAAAPQEFAPPLVVHQPMPVSLDALPAALEKLAAVRKETPRGWRATPVRDQITGLILYIDILPL